MKDKKAPPIIWFGGKAHLCSKILKYVPDHHIYVEPYGGAGNLLFAKKPSEVEVYNDLFLDVVRFYRTLRDEKKFKKFYMLVSLTPYSRVQYYICRDLIKKGVIKDDVKHAWAFFLACNQAFCGSLYNSWGIGFKASSRGMMMKVSAYLSKIDGLEEVHNRLKRVQIDCRNGLDCIKHYDDKETFFYIDPPYVHEARASTKGNSRYVCEMEDNEHEELVDYLCHKLKGMAILSGYKSDIYSPLCDNGWLLKKHRMLCYAAAKTRGTGLIGDGKVIDRQNRLECLWISPNAIKNKKKGGSLW